MQYRNEIETVQDKITRHLVIIRHICRLVVLLFLLFILLLSVHGRTPWYNSSEMATNTRLTRIATLSAGSSLVFLNRTMGTPLNRNTYTLGIGAIIPVSKLIKVIDYLKKNINFRGYQPYKLYWSRSMTRRENIAYHLSRPYETRGTDAGMSKFRAISSPFFNSPVFCSILFFPPNWSVFALQGYSAAIIDRMNHITVHDRDAPYWFIIAIIAAEYPCKAMIINKTTFKMSQFHV